MSVHQRKPSAQCALSDFKHKEGKKVNGVLCTPYNNEFKIRFMDNGFMHILFHWKLNSRGMGLLQICLICFTLFVILRGFFLNLHFFFRFQWLAKSLHRLEWRKLEIT